MAFLIGGANSVTGGYEVANSCRFNDNDSAYMKITPGGAGDANIWTLSIWLKRGSITSIQYVFGASTDAANFESFRFNSEDTFSLHSYASGSGVYYFDTTHLFRDPTAWVHLVMSRSGATQKYFVNGVEGSRAGEATSTATGDFNTTDEHRLAHRPDKADGTQHFDGYIAEVFWIDGTAYTASSFGEFDEDSPTIWKPKDCKGDLTFGTNGFYMDFEDSSNLGNDVNGGTDWTEVNLAAVDQATDTPTNNFATWNPLNVPASNAPVFSEGNCNLASAANAAEFTGTSTIGVTNGKWYAEFKNIAGDYCIVGITSNPGEDARNNVRPGTYATSWGYNASGSGEVQNNNSGITYTCDSWEADDIIGVYIDCDNSKLYFAKNGTVQNSGTGISLVSGDTYFFTQGDGDNESSSRHAANFGGCPAFAISSGNTDANGYGNFEYDPSAGTFDSASKDFYALCTKNLAEFG